MSKKSCTLTGVTVRGSVLVSRGASLTRTSGTQVHGNILVSSAADPPRLEDVLVAKNGGDVVVDSSCDFTLAVVENRDVSVEGSGNEFTFTDGQCRGYELEVEAVAGPAGSRTSPRPEPGGFLVLVGAAGVGADPDVVASQAVRLRELPEEWPATLPSAYGAFDDTEGE